MIDKNILKQAKNIRTEFIELSNKMLESNDILVKLKKELEDSVVRLTEIKSKKYPDGPAGEKQFLFEIESELAIYELEVGNVKKFIEPINIRIEKLRVDEQKLYEQIKKNYPSLSDEQIVQEVQSYIGVNDSSQSYTNI